MATKWKDLPTISKNCFERNQTLQCSTDSISYDIQDISGNNLKSLLLEMQIEEGVVCPELIVDRNEPATKPIQKRFKKFGNRAYTYDSLCQEIDRILDGKKESSSSQIGKEEISVLYGLLNWYGAGRDPWTFNNLFMTHKSDNQSNIFRAPNYTSPQYVLDTINEHVQSISSIEVMFTVHYGRMPGLQLMFSPVLKMQAVLSQQKPLHEALSALNSSEMQHAHLSDDDGGVVYFNYMRPCPPFGNCNGGGGT